MAAVHALSSGCALVLLLLVQPHACTVSMTTTLQDKCNQYAGGSQSDYDFCMKTMQADRASAAADARGLAVIAARIARAMAKATGDKIEAALLGAGTMPPARRDLLSLCAVEYAATVRRLGLAARVAAGPAGGGARELRDAQAFLAKAYGAPTVCNAKFANAGLPDSPITVEDRRLDDVINMAITFLPVTSSRA